MASPTRWTWVWVSSESWWWTGRPGVLRFTGLQRVRHDWATELNWTELISLEKEMAIHYSVLAWRLPGTGEPGGLPSMGSHRVGHDWRDLAAAAAGFISWREREKRLKQGEIEHIGWPTLSPTWPNFVFTVYNLSFILSSMDFVHFQLCPFLWTWKNFSMTFIFYHSWIDFKQAFIPHQSNEIHQWPLCCQNQRSTLSSYLPWLISIIWHRWLCLHFWNIF